MYALQKSYDAIRDLGANLVAISPQTPANNQKVREQHRLEYPILTDANNSYAKELSIAHDLPKELQDVYRGFGADLATFNEGNDWMLPLATRIVLDATGKVRALDANADYTIRPEPEATLEILRTLPNS